MPGLRLTRVATLFAGLVAVCLLVAAPAQGTHPRPKDATAIRMSLVPAYAACAAPNRTHGPPLAFGSCNPPVQTATRATVGTPDAFGGAATSASSLRLTEWESIPGGPTEGDILIDIVLNDVRCVPTGARCGTANASGPADYSGEMRFSFTFRLSDHHNPSAWPEAPVPATVQDFAIEHSWACVQSGSTSTGSTCDLHTSLNTLIPEGGGAVQAINREIWELQAVRIYDGGADGEGDTTADNTVFARPGVFIP
jgi:hypothetical protein